MATAVANQIPAHGLSFSLVWLQQPHHSICLCWCLELEVRHLCWLLTDRQVWSRRCWGGEVSWFRDEAFADSIFTHQTEVFPVSTRPNSRSHHLTLLARLVFFFHHLPAPLPVWQLPKPLLTLFSLSAVYSVQLLSQSTLFFWLCPVFFFTPPSSWCEMLLLSFPLAVVCSIWSTLGSE